MAALLATAYDLDNLGSTDECSRRMDAAYRAIVRFPWLVLAVVAVVTVLLGSGVAHLRVDSSVGTLLPRGDPGQALYAQVIERFGNDEIDIIGVLAPDVLSASTLEKIRTVTTRAAAIGS